MYKEVVALVVSDFIKAKQPRDRASHITKTNPVTKFSASVACEYLFEVRGRKCVPGPAASKVSIGVSQRQEE
jgi:hypothetical protein